MDLYNLLYIILHCEHVINVLQKLCSLSVY